MTDEETALLSNLSLGQIKDFRAGRINPAIKIRTLQLKDNAIERIKAGKGKLNGLIWFLSRRYPKQFADPATQIQFSTGSTTNNNVLVVSADVAEGLLRRSKATLGEIDQLILDKQPETASDAQ